MTGSGARRKGKIGELAAAKALHPLWPEMKRCYNQSRSGDEAPDIDAPGCPFWIEVKYRKDAEGEAFARRAYLQALKASHKDKRPVLVVMRKNRGDWECWYNASTITGIPGMIKMPTHGYSGPDNKNLSLTRVSLTDFVNTYEKEDGD